MQQLLPEHEILIPSDEGIAFDPEETGSTFYENSLIKAKALFDSIKKQEKDLHFAVNAAGIGGPSGLLSNTSSYINGTHCPLRNNIYGTIIPLMFESRFFIEKKHGGAIVNVASVDGLLTVPEGSLYGASKAAIIGLSRSVAAGFAKENDELGFPLIRINTLAPGLTNTSLSWQQVKENQQSWEGEYITPASKLWKEKSPEWIAEQVGKELASPEMMADSIMFLCSSDASFITGSVHVVDRGDTA